MDRARSRRRLVVACTGFALVAFAMNSVLCRMALRDATIDPASFATIRLASGAAVLAAIAAFAGGERGPGSRGGWISAALLFLYAAGFSFAYVSLSIGTGALILFAAVQVTMISAGLRGGERLGGWEWTGLALALAGLVYLVFPGLSAPSPTGSALMALAGVSWGAYSLRGRGSVAPLTDTARNFLLSVPLVLAVSLVTIRGAHVSASGATLAVLSGALASGLGYVVWYAALRGLTATRAAIVQLAVPVLAALGGVLLLAEEVTMRLALSAALILGGIRLSLLRAAPPARADREVAE